MIEKVDDSGEPVVRLENIVKRYKNHLALNQVSMEIGPGVTGLLGPNGAGKSTLIKVLMGLVSVNSGSGSVFGKPLDTAGREIRSRVGYMPEDDCYIAKLSGVEVVAFAASLSGLPPIEALRRAHEILDFSGSEQERYRNVDTYSTGMRQKIKFAQAIVHDPPLLILDEPTSSLDPEERESMLARIRTMATKYGKTVIISTHILPDVQAICDQVIILAKGEVRLSQPLEMLSKPAKPGINVTTAQVATPLIEALRSRNGIVEERGETDFVLETVNGDSSTLVWELARETGISILSMAPMINSLEEVFMRVVQEEKALEKQRANS